MATDEQNVKILGLTNVAETGRYDREGSIVVEAQAVEPIFPDHRCADPDLTPRLVRDGYRSGKRREISDTPHAGIPVTIAYRQARARCRTCGTRALDELVPHLHPKRLMTNRLHALIGHEAVRDTHAGVGRRYGVSERTVVEVFRETAEQVLGAQLAYPPLVLGIDFTKLSRGRRIGVVANLETRTVIDLVNNGMSGLREYLREFRQISVVQAICTDLDMGWLKLHMEFFPDALHIADKWHVMARAGHAVDSLVWAEANRTAADKKRYYRTSVLHLLRQRLEGRAMREGGEQQLQVLRKDAEHLVDAYLAKESYFKMYDVCQSPDDAREYYTTWRSKLSDAIAPDFKRRCLVDKSWEPAVFNYFARPFTNAYVEAINHTIKGLHRSGRGYGFEVLRAKLRLTPSSAPWVAGYPFDGSFQDERGSGQMPWWSLALYGSDVDRFIMEERLNAPHAIPDK